MPSTGVASTHRRKSIPMECSRISTNEWPSPKTRVLAEKLIVSAAILAILPPSREVEPALETRTVHQHLVDATHAVVAVDVAKVGPIHRVLRGLLGMARKAEGLDLMVAPAGLVRWIRVQAPLRRPSLDPPSGEDEAANLLCLEDPQLRGPWRVGVGSGNALAGCIVLIAMEGTDEPASAYAPPRGGPQVGAQVHSIGLGDADLPVLVTPGDDVLPHPGLLDELGLQHVPTARNEVPALGEWGRQRGGRVLPSLGCQCQAFPTMSLKSATSLPVNAPSQGSSTGLTIPH